MRPALALLLFLVPLAPIAACSAPALLGDGQACFVSVDCAKGLACVPNNPMNPDAGRKCTSDLTGIGGTPPMMDGGMNEAAAMDAPADVIMMDAPKDTNMPDMGSVMDTGSTMDSATD